MMNLLKLKPFKFKQPATQMNPGLALKMGSRKCLRAPLPETVPNLIGIGGGRFGARLALAESPLGRINKFEVEPKERLGYNRSISLPFYFSHAEALEQIPDSEILELGESLYVHAEQYEAAIVRLLTPINRLIINGDGTPDENPGVFGLASLLKSFYHRCDYELRLPLGCSCSSLLGGSATEVAFHLIKEGKAHLLFSGEQKQELSNEVPIWASLSPSNDGTNSPVLVLTVIFTLDVPELREALIELSKRAEAQNNP